MATRNHRDYEAFVELNPNDWYRKTASYGQSITANINYDAIAVSYPNSTTEIFSYYEGGLAGTLVATVTVVYTNASKDDISTVERT